MKEYVYIIVVFIMVNMYVYHSYLRTELMTNSLIVCISTYTYHRVFIVYKSINTALFNTDVHNISLQF